MRACGVAQGRTSILALSDDMHMADISCATQERLSEIQERLTPRERGTLLWSYGNLRCYPGQDLMDGLCSDPTHNLQAYDTQVPASFACLPASPAYSCWSPYVSMPA